MTGHSQVEPSVGGEKMNKKILGVLVALLAVALLTVPVMGAKATKIEGVTVITENAGAVPYEGYPRWVSDGTISHGRGGTNPDATVTLIIPGVGTYVGAWDSEWISSANWKKDPVEIVITSIHTMTFEEGTFEGVNQRRITGPPLAPNSILEDHSVLQGIGIFKGWTLKISYEGTVEDLQFGSEGYLIIPK
jgi:hypothetical protein